MSDAGKQVFESYCYNAQAHGYKFDSAYEIAHEVWQAYEVCAKLLLMVAPSKLRSANRLLKALREPECVEEALSDHAQEQWKAVRAELRSQAETAARKLKLQCVPHKFPGLNLGKFAKDFGKGMSTQQLLDAAPAFPLRAVSGIYILLNDQDRPIYVGQSTNVLARLGQHAGDLSKAPYFTKATMIEVPIGMLAAVEKQYIKLLKPLLNGSGVSPRARKSRKATADALRLARELQEYEASLPQGSVQPITSFPAKFRPLLRERRGLLKRAGGGETPVRVGYSHDSA